MRSTDLAKTRRILQDAAIVGVHTTAQGDLPERSSDDLLLESIEGALADAGLTIDDLDGIAGGRSPTDSAATAFPGYWSELLGRPMRYYSTVDAAAAAHSANILHAALAVATGLAETIVVVGGGSRGASREDSVRKMAYAHGEFDVSWGTLVPSWFALAARRHMHEYGTTAEQLAEIAVATRMWAAMHPQSIMKKPLTIADDLRPVAFVGLLSVQRWGGGHGDHLPRAGSGLPAQTGADPRRRRRLHVSGLCQRRA